MKRWLLLLLIIAISLSAVSCGGYNAIMREHLGSKDNYHDVDAVFYSYEKIDDFIYLHVTVEDRSAFDLSEANSKEIRLTLVGDSCAALLEFFENKEICEGDKITVKCSTLIYMDTTFYYIAEMKFQDKTLLSFDDGLKNIIEYMDSNKSLF